MAAVKTFDRSQVSVVIGTIIVNSFISVTASRDEDVWDYKAGAASGESTRTKNNSTLGTIVLTLPYTSTDNALMSALFEGGATFPVLIKDSNGTQVITMTGASIAKPADVSLEQDVADREWNIKGNIDILAGGNS